MDNWQAFKSPMSERFINKHEMHENVFKMQRLMYRNDIDDYLVKMNLLNARVEEAGALYHHMIRAGLPTGIMTHIPYGEEEPDDTTEFLEFMRHMGKRNEEHQRMTKGEWKDSSKQDINDPPSLTKPPRRFRFSKPSSTPTSIKISGPANSSKEPAMRATGSGWKATGSGWKNKEEWLKGISADVQKARHEKDQCARWGKSYQMLFQCLHRIIGSAAGCKKRKAGWAGVANTDKQAAEPILKRPRCMQELALKKGAWHSVYKSPAVACSNWNREAKTEEGGHEKTKWAWKERE